MKKPSDEHFSGHSRRSVLREALLAQHRRRERTTAGIVVIDAIPVKLAELFREAIYQVDDTTHPETTSRS